jgi:hypothetical protein
MNLKQQGRSDAVALVMGGTQQLCCFHHWVKWLLHAINSWEWLMTVWLAHTLLACSSTTAMCTSNTVLPS